MRKLPTHWRRFVLVAPLLAYLSGGAFGEPPGVPEPDREPSPGRVAEPEPEPVSGTVVLPGIFFSPDRGLSGYLGALRYFRIAADARMSRVSTAVTVSTKKDVVLDLDPDLWLDGDRLQLAASSQLALRTDVFFGIGNDTPGDAEESYRRLGGSVQLRAVRRLPHSVYVGGLYDLRYIDIRSVDAAGALATGAVVGSEGGLVSGIGVLARLDTRDNVLAPRRGVLAEISPRWYSGVLGSDYAFVRFYNDLRYYLPVGVSRELAFQLQLDARTGEPPFDALSFAGGADLLRGMLDGRFRDNVFAGGQVEFRTHVYGRFGAVAFAAAGRVAPSLDELGLGGMHYSGGLGVRFAVKPKEKLNVRFDAAASDAGTGLYLQVLEAF